MKSLTPRFVAAATVALMLALAAPAAESLSLLLQKGIFAEETEGNLESAIKIYEQIAAESAANRTLATQAQFRLAVCFQKQGKKPEAVRVLNGLIQQPEVDAGISQKARAMLVAMGEKPAVALSIRKIPLPIKSGWFWQTSPDGRYVTYAPAQSEDVAVCEISTGKSWVVFQGTKGKEEPWSDALFSADGQHVSIDVSGTMIYVVRTDGTALRKLYETGGNKERVTNLGWSADGSQVIAKFWPADDKADRIIMALDAKTGARNDLARISNVGPKDGTGWLSPDGRYLTRAKPTYPRTITIIDLKTGREEAVVTKDVGRVIGWAPGMARLLFTRTGLGGTDLCAIAIEDGKPAGEVARVWANFEPTTLVGVTRDGSIYYCTGSHAAGSFELWVMDGVLAVAQSQKDDRQLTAQIPPEELFGPANIIEDKKFGLRLQLPENWTVQNAERINSGGSVLLLKPAELPDAVVYVNYRPTVPWVEGPVAAGQPGAKIFGPKAPGPAEVDTWLREFADRTARVRIEVKFAGYENDSTTFRRSTIGGHHALSWAARFEKNDEKWVEIFTAVYAEKTWTQMRVSAPASRIDAVRPAFQQLVESVRLQ